MNGKPAVKLLKHRQEKKDEVGMIEMQGFGKPLVYMDVGQGG